MLCNVHNSLVAIIQTSRHPPTRRQTNSRTPWKTRKRRTGACAHAAIPHDVFQENDLYVGPPFSCLKIAGSVNQQSSLVPDCDQQQQGRVIRIIMFGTRYSQPLISPARLDRLTYLSSPQNRCPAHVRCIRSAPFF